MRKLVITITFLFLPSLSYAFPVKFSMSSLKHPHERDLFSILIEKQILLNIPAPKKEPYIEVFIIIQKCILKQSKRHIGYIASAVYTLKAESKYFYIEQLLIASGSLNYIANKIIKTAYNLSLLFDSKIKQREEKNDYNPCWINCRTYPANSGF